MESPVSARTLRCFEHFEDLHSAILAGNQDDAEAAVKVVDALARFRIWATNLGAHHPVSDLKSADHRLRSAPAVLKHLTDVLDDLCDTLQDAVDIANGSRPDQSTIDEAASDDCMWTTR